MKLFYYDHCPFSARARMVLKLKSIEAQQQILPADDEQTITDLIGKHQIPVLVLDAGETLPDSIEITKYLDRLAGPPILGEPDNPALDSWLESFVPNMQYLGYPRWIRIGLGEFARPEATQHFREKKTETIGDFVEAVANTEAKAREVEAQLGQLPTLVDLTPPPGQVRWDDVILFPMLRSLTVVEAVNWPEEVRSYTEKMAQGCGLDTFFDRPV